MGITALAEDGLEYRGSVVMRTGPDPLGRLPENANVIWGVVRTKPIRTGLPGRIRIRLRNSDFGMAFVRHQGWTRHFILFDCGDHWELGLEQGANLTVRNV